MAMEFRISVDLSVQLASLDPLGAVMPSVARAVEQLAYAGQARWREGIQAVPGLWIGERQAYMASIETRQISAYAWEIVSDYKAAEDIESGRPARDLKRMLDTSMKVRLTKTGKRYLIIPMRHNTPGNTAHAPAMPDHVYAAARDLSHSRITGHGRRLSGTGAHSIKTKRPATVRARKYVWGDRLEAGLAPKLASHHKSDPYAGMVRMKESSGGSSYMTFRVMMEGSSGWVIPARPGLWIARTVAQSLQRSADQDIPQAVVKDLAGAA